MATGAHLSKAQAVAVLAPAVAARVAKAQAYAVIEYRPMVGAGCDPFFDQVSLLLHFDGSVGDASPVGQTPVINQAALSTASPKFGRGCLQPGGNSLQFANPVGGPNDLSGSDFTIEFWINPSAAGAYTLMENQGGYGMPSNGGFYIYTDSDLGSITLQMEGTGTWAIVPGPFPLGVWSHIAFVGAVGLLYGFGNGIGSGIPRGYTQLPSNGAPLTIGFNPYTAGLFNGFIDEVRITKGLARYTTNFTPPTEPFLGSCTVAVPDVVGESQAQATADLNAAQLQVGAVTLEPSTVAAGTVLVQSPVPGTVVFMGSAVALTVASSVLIPNVVGELARQAAADLKAAGFVLGLTTLLYDELAAVGQVLTQNPAAGTYAPVGAYIYLTVSQGPRPVYVPDLTGLDSATALAALIAKGLLAGVVNSRANKAVAGLVIAQNPVPYTQVAKGALVGYTLSTGPAVIAPMPGFDMDATVISQYANSPTLLALIANMDAYLDPTADFQAFYDFVWNVDTAQGFGLDIWGRIVDISRLLTIPNEALSFGFVDHAAVTDVVPFNQGPFNNRGIAVTQTYVLSDDAYRVLILCKALANISATTAPALNQLLRNLFPGRGTCYVVDLGGMAMQFAFEFALTVTEYAILTQSNALPHPAGVSVSILQVASTQLWGFTEAGPLAQPFGQGVFYSPLH